MGSQREYRDRDRSEVAVLDALIDRRDGLTVFELRSHAKIDIDELETALSNLKEDGLIVVEEEGDRTVIRPHESVVPDPDEPDEDRSILHRIRERLPF